MKSILSLHELSTRWYISAGLNKIFDTFDCQVHFFTSPSPGKFYAKIFWRITEPDGEFFTKDTVQRFVQDPKNPAHFLNHDNEYLHYKDDWYIIDYDPKEFVLVYYKVNLLCCLSYAYSHVCIPQHLYRIHRIEDCFKFLS